METIKINIPEGKTARQTTDSCGNITIQFVEEKDYNVFTKGIISCNAHLKKFCEEVFGLDDVLMITSGSEPIQRPDLARRSFLVDSRFTVILHTGQSCTTVIEIIKKQ